MIRLLLDQGLPRDTATLVRTEGYECNHVGEIGMSTAPDDQILSRAKHDHAIVVTLDADFHALLARTRGDSPSVIRLRVEGLGARETASIIQLALDRFREELEAGAVVTVKANKIVCHRLPIGRPK